MGAGKELPFITSSCCQNGIAWHPHLKVLLIPAGQIRQTLYQNRVGALQVLFPVLHLLLERLHTCKPLFPVATLETIEDACEP